MKFRFGKVLLILVVMALFLSLHVYGTLSDIKADPPKFSFTSYPINPANGKAPAATPATPVNPSPGNLPAGVTSHRVPLNNQTVSRNNAASDIKPLDLSPYFAAANNSASQGYMPASSGSNRPVLDLSKYLANIQPSASQGMPGIVFNFDEKGALIPIQSSPKPVPPKPSSTPASGANVTASNLLVKAPTSIAGYPGPTSYTTGVIYDNKGLPYYSPYSIPTAVVKSYISFAGVSSSASRPAPPQSGSSAGSAVPGVTIVNLNGAARNTSAGNQPMFELLSKSDAAKFFPYANNLSLTGGSGN